MALENTIDLAVADFEAQLTQSQDLFIDDIEELREEGLSTEEILAILAGISMVAIGCKIYKCSKL